VWRRHELYGMIIPREITEEIKRRTDILQVVGKYVELRRAGIGSWKGLCPFHNEKTPSFHVSEQGYFKCFGCDAKGDVFTFLQNIEQYSFGEVVRQLAADAGVEIPEEDVSPAERRARERAESERSRLFELTALAMAFYQEALGSDAGAKARRYLDARGVNETVRQTFNLGYAPEGGESFLKHLSRTSGSQGNARFQLEDAERCGLVRRNERGHYDFFRDRVLFPVFDRQKRVVGFSGRVLDPAVKAAKYINTPDSPIFHKKDQLYGIHLAQPAMRSRHRAVVVEGHPDVVAMHQFGLDEAVAPMGTALTKEQIVTLGRLARTVVVVFDGDAAGQRAARRALPLFLEAGVDGRVVRLPPGADPDEFVRDEGTDALRELLDKARPMVEQFIDDLAGETDGTIPGKVEAAEEAAGLLAKVGNPTERELYAGRLAASLGLSGGQVVRAVRAAVARARRNGLSQSRHTPAVRSGESRAANETSAALQPGSSLARNGATGSAETAPQTGASQPPPPVLELEALAIVIGNWDALAGESAIAEVEDMFMHADVKKLYQLAVAALSSGAVTDLPGWLADMSSGVQDKVWQAITDERLKGLEGAPRALHELLDRMRCKRVDAEFAEVDSQLRSAISRGDVGLIRSLTESKVELQRRKHELLGGMN